MSRRTHRHDVQREAEEHKTNGLAIAVIVGAVLLVIVLIVGGPERASCVETAKSALARFQVCGITTTVPFHERLLQQKEFERAEIDTSWIDRNFQMAAG